NLAKAGIPVSGGSAGSTLDIGSLPAPVASIVRAAYGDATAHIFLISAAIGVVGILAVLLLPKVVLRTTLDLPAASDPVGLDGLPETEEAVLSTLSARGAGDRT